MNIVANTELLAGFANQRAEGSIMNVAYLWKQVMFNLVIQATNKP